MYFLLRKAQIWTLLFWKKVQIEESQTVKANQLGLSVSVGSIWSDHGFWALQNSVLPEVIKGVSDPL